MDDKTKIKFFCFLFAQSALIFVCSALNSPEAGDAAVAIVRHRQNLRAEKVIARNNIWLEETRNYPLYFIDIWWLLHKFQTHTPGLGSKIPRVGSFTVYASQQYANSYSRRQAELRIQGEAEELLNEYGGICAWIFPYVIPFSIRKAEMVIN